MIFNPELETMMEKILVQTDNVAAHLVYTGTVVEGMRVAAVVHEARNVAGGVRRLQELCLHVHLV